MRLKAIPRITLGLVSLGLLLLLAFDQLLHLFPREADTIAALRARVANNVAIQVAALVQARDWRTVDRTLQAMQSRDEDVVSLGLRRADGALLSQAGEHARHWQAAARTPNQTVVGILAGGERWGALEITFRPAGARGWAAWLLSGPTVMLALFSLGASLLYFLYLRRTLHQLDPTAAVPERVRAAFDALTEGVLIVNPGEEILLVNQRFQAIVPQAERGGLVGRKASQLSWLVAAEDGGGDARPWARAMRSRQQVRGQPFQVLDEGKVVAHVVVNCSPLLDEDGGGGLARGVRGCLVTVDDVTALERSHQQLLEVLADLATSKEQLEMKNLELEQLANADALSGCMNRRAFFEALHTLWAKAHGPRDELACILADIDHFKSINDRYGHAVGDEAIQRFAAVLRRAVPRGSIVGRYGGEEFCIALPGVGLAQALQLAEAMRQRVAEETAVGAAAGQRVAMSASFGVSTLRDGARDEAELVDQADRAMYQAKQGGRNRVLAFAALAVAEPVPGAAQEILH